MVHDYTTVTELPGAAASPEQLSMLYTRYAYAAGFCEGKEVLEVACGAGLGLGYLAKKATRVVGGDFTEPLLRVARHYYGEAMPLVRLDAHALPFRDRRFDVIILYEAIYYLAGPGQFVKECRRVLRDGGVLLICTVNRGWSDFNPSPFRTHYFSAGELSDLLREHRFQVELHGAFPVVNGSVKDTVVSFLKRAAVTLHLMPKTMKGKELLKRIFFGKPVPLPAKVEEGMAAYSRPAPLSSDSSDSRYKVLFALARAR